MRLKNLTLSGFKSFARKTTLEFSAPIVAVVGPNGSGKSNVAEAFRFVLGEQSMKSMRGKRGEDLIFAGGTSAPRVNTASITLTFADASRAFGLDFEEVVLERVVHRDGINEYRLNGSPVRLRDILELLAKANIGSSGHHIISQGEADRILNASITERREMIEDALALKVYHFKKDESQRKLAKTRENLDKAVSIRKEILPHLKFLEKQAEKVKKAEDLRAELLNLYHEYLSREEKYLSAEKKRLVSQKHSPAAELAEIDKKLCVIKNRLEGQKGKKLEEDLLVKGEKLSTAEKRREELLREQAKAEGVLSAEERMWERSRKEAEAAGTVPFSEVRELAVRIEEISKESEELADLGALRSLLSKIRELVRVFVTENKSRNKTPADLEERLALLRGEASRLKSSLAGAEKDMESLRAEVEMLRRKIGQEATEGREGEKEMFTLLNRKGELSMALKDLDSAMRILEVGEASFKEELREAEAILGLSAIRYSHVSIKEEDVLKEDRHLQEERKKKLEKNKIRLEEMGGAGGSDLLKEYEEVKSREAFYTKEIGDLEKSAENLEEMIKELTEKLDVEFRAGVLKINEEFKKFFVMMFGGGNASLSVIAKVKRRRKVEEGLEGAEDLEMEEEEEEGVDVSVSLPGKRTKGLDMLSGGERALTSIALLFAISQVNPPPFIILDETDAALDESNSRKYGDMVEALCKHSQLILITHNRETMSRAGILYGVTMGGDGVSKLLSVKFDEAVAVSK